MNATVETQSAEKAQTQAAVVAASVETEGFVAINYISCREDYRERFEHLFQTRARAIDTMPGFRHMYVLRPQKEGDAYLVVSHWDSEENFKAWMKSPAFIEGHKRGFDDVKKAKEEGGEPPLSSDFKTYRIIAR